MESTPGIPRLPFAAWAAALAVGGLVVIADWLLVSGAFVGVVICLAYASFAVGLAARPVAAAYRSVDRDPWLAPKDMVRRLHHVAGGDLGLGAVLLGLAASLFLFVVLPGAPTLIAPFGLVWLSCVGAGATLITNGMRRWWRKGAASVRGPGRRLPIFIGAAIAMLPHPILVWVLSRSVEALMLSPLPVYAALWLGAGVVLIVSGVGLFHHRKQPG